MAVPDTSQMTRKMRTLNVLSHTISVIILAVTVVDNVFATAHHDTTEKQTFSSEIAHHEKYITKNFNETNISKKKQNSNQRKFTDRSNGYKHSIELSSETYEPVLRQKRSVLPDHRYGIRLQAGGRTKRFHSDYGYGSRLQAGKNIANVYEPLGLFGVARPGKRTDEVIDIYMLNEGTKEDKRLGTDYGYGSSLQAAENIAMNWDRNGLFGVMGPGKINGLNYVPNVEATKRISADFGYGSRTQAAENAAMSLSHGGLYGVYGPGKRSTGRLRLQEIPEYDIYKTDSSYGSREEVDKKLSKLLTTEKLSGEYASGRRISSDIGSGSKEQPGENLAKRKYRPGKRSYTTVRYRPGEWPEINLIRKRFSSDFGYGSREQAAENLAKSSAKGILFGVYGPGKRSGLERNIRSGDVIEADSGYGSRIYAGSQIAKDIVAIDNLFGLFGPGRRK